jgi:hypothetical protein
MAHSVLRGGPGHLLGFILRLLRLLGEVDNLYVWLSAVGRITYEEIVVMEYRHVDIVKANMLSRGDVCHDCKPLQMLGASTQ